MILAIVGSTNLDSGSQTALATSFIELALYKLQPELVISGGAKGIDTLAEDICTELGVDFQKFLPENPCWEPFGYKARNIEIAQECTHLVCIRTSQSKTYGSGWTADYAERLGKKVKRTTI